MANPILLTAWLDSPLAGEPPQLDSLLEWRLSPQEPGFRAGQDAGLPHSRVDRQHPAPPQGAIPIPILRERVGEWQVACCSGPILPLPSAQTVEHIAKRIGVENAAMLREDCRLVVSTTNSWTKSYRLPLRVRAVPCVRWFCVGSPRGLKKALRDVFAIGKKVSDGYGRVRAWECEPAGDDYSWFAPSESGTVLMRPLPLLADGREWLPRDLAGCKRDYGACVPPYWHPERYTEVVLPC